MKICPSCNTSMPDEAIFCPTCGKPLVSLTKCPICGHLIPKEYQNSCNSDLLFEVKGVQFKMKYVEGGSFIMGAQDNDNEAHYWEKPSHWVKIDSFYMSETQVTQMLWNLVMKEGPFSFKGNANPVESVSIHECNVFIKRLNAITGRKFSLPTEAQWEYAARGGNKSKGYIYAGSNQLDKVSWYRDNSDSKTHQVATKEPNELGLYDMTGNVWEWCNDFYNDNYYSISPQDNPNGPLSGDEYVIRGGCWLNSPKGCRITSRAHKSPSYFSNIIGFRLVLV